MKKYFICSDIHSNYTALKQALLKNNFNPKNEEDIIVVAGDIFDRGSQSVYTYLYLKEMTEKGKAVVLNGNHHEMIIDFLNGKDSFFHFKYNGLRQTVDDFVGESNSWEKYVITHTTDEEQATMTNQEWQKLWMDYSKQCAKKIKEEYPGLLDWMLGLSNYLELKHTIITHGAIDCNSHDWRFPKNGWNKLHWAKPEEAAFLKNNTGKHIYLGHIDSDTIRDVFGENRDNYSIFTRPAGDITYLDSCSILTNRVNMVIVEDEPLDEDKLAQ